MLRITANQVTLARLVLLPVPMTMIYVGDTAWRMAALALFILLGLTDAVDGMLARRYGGTPLGALLDPIVDKIFLVATFGPLADLGVVPPWFVTILFVRELAVTVLRSIALEERVSFRTSKIAKLKTTVQMAGAGFIFLYWVFPSGPAIRAIPVLALVGGVLPVVVQLARGRRPAWRAWSGFVLVSVAALVRVVLPPEPAIDALMGIIVGFTVISGLEYFWGLRGTLRDRFARVPAELLRLAVLAAVVPLGFLPVLQRDGAPVWAILGVLAFELAAGGVDNSLAQVGRSRGPWPDVVRAALQASVAVLLARLLTGGAPVGWIGIAGAAAVAVTAADVFGRFARHRDHFLALSSGR
jgi:CDP-diacylglycerol--glycerol-3-phosphate 3-phosphatidyltransferase